ncbi:MAG: hypothetical protein IPK08_10745 [Bacteroidetes bacterium]|nr:hypothetical protein [Bacteroidota bacterium]
MDYIFASTTFFNINKAIDTKYFKKLLADSLKWTLLIEFLINFHTFSLIIEILIFPFMLFIVTMQVFSETDKQYEAVNKLFTGILSMIGILIFLYSLILAIYKSNEFFTFGNLNEFLLPVYMTILLMPFLYVIALFIQYESLFVRLRFMTSDKVLYRTVKLQIYINASCNLNNLKLISDHINAFDLKQAQNIKFYLRKLIEKRTSR